MLESAKRYSIFIYSALILTTLLVYWQAGSFGFVDYDDNIYVYDNPHVMGGLTADNIVWAFTTGHGSFWHPVTWLSLMLDRQLFGPQPAGGMHIVNILLHIACTLLLFALLRKMTGRMWPAAFVAAAFALHPMHVESVAWITERKDVLSTFFLLLTLAAYARHAKGPSVRWYIASLALFAVGLMAKPMLITLPFLMLLFDYWPLGRLTGKHPIRQCLIEKIPFLALAAIFAAITVMTQKAGGGLVPVSVIPFWDRVKNAFISYAAYIGKMFWPQGMAVHYPAQTGIAFWQFLLCFLLIVGVSVLAICLCRKRKHLMVGWFWFVGTLVPVIGLIQFAGSSYADRFTYVPYIGLFIILAWGVPDLLAAWPQRPWALGIIPVFALAALAVVARNQVSYWGDSINLFTHTINVTKDNDVAYDGRGVSYAGLGRWDEALRDLSEAITIRPDFAEAYSNRSAVYLYLGRWQEALQDCDKAIALKPDNPKMYRNRSIANSRLGNEPEAIADLGHAAELDPDNADIHYNLANKLAAQGRYDEAAGEYRAALRLRGDWADCMCSLALLIATHPELSTRDVNEAVRLASRACELAGYRNPTFMGAMAAAYAAAGRFTEAVATARKGVSLAEAANQPQVKAILQYHLSFYEQGKPYVASPIDPGKR
jgi:protein O-mannosyl-transferase